MHTTHDIRDGGRHAHTRASHWLSVLIAVVAVLLAMPGMARAQSPAELPPAPAYPQEAAPEEKSPGQALALSLVPTGVGAGLMVASGYSESGTLGTLGALLVLTGPSFGHFYAGESATGWKHIGLRAGAGGIVLVGTVWALVESCSWGLFGTEAHCDPPSPGAASVMIGGAVLGTASAVYSIYDAPRAARRANDRNRSRQLMLTPAPVAGPQGTSGLGLHLTGRF